MGKKRQGTSNPTQCLAQSKSSVGLRRNPEKKRREGQEEGERESKEEGRKRGAGKGERC